MKKIYKVAKHMLFFLLLFTFIACSESAINKEITGGDEGKEMVKVPIKLSVEPMKIVGKRNTAIPITKTPKTRAGIWGETADDVSGVNEDNIQNLWVLQYTSAGNLVKTDYYDNIDQMYFSTDLVGGDNYTLCFVANMGQSAYTTAPTTLTEFKKGKPYEDIIAQINSSSLLPMVGIKTGVNVPSGVSGGLNVEMKRAVARLNYTYSFSSEMQDVINIGNLGFEQIIVKNIPKKVSYDLSDNSPATSELSEMTERSIGFAKGTAETIGIYLPHNARGVNSNITSATEKVDEPYATYVKLGTYRDYPYGDNSENTDIYYLTYLGENDTNDFNLKANTKYNITSTIKGAYINDSRVRYGVSTSNCYIIPRYIGSEGTTANPNRSVLIPVRRANMSKHLGKQLSDVSTGWTAEVLWRDYSSNNITIAQNSPYKEHGYFKVTVSNPSGNAIIVIKDGSDNILWSWHIWMTEYSDVKTSYILHNGHKFMTSVLGGYDFNNTEKPTDPYSYPCYFQWGRKDPFPGCNASSTSAFREIYSGATGFTTTTVEGEAWSTTMLTGGDPTNTMRYATRNPMKLINKANDITEDWFTNTLENMDPYLWRTANGEKTVNDPCPMGWRVAYAKGTSKTESDWDISQISGRGNMIGTSFYYPMAGWILYAGTLTNKIRIEHTGTFAFYWQNYSILPITKKVNSLYVYISELLINGDLRYKGFPIHCVKIK